MYDLIGDIHGYATPLKKLLVKLDYRVLNGVWCHSERQVIFLGDFVDRGPEQVETVQIARAMVEAGQALAVMGNHEFNAVAWATPDAENPGEWLRRHSAKNLKQHRRFLKQVGEESSQHISIIDWFRTLPLYLDLPGLRVIHACWHSEYLDTLAPFLDDQQCIRPEAWQILTKKDNEVFEALETVLKGLEIPLPTGQFFYDKDGNQRKHVRTRWWHNGGLTYRDLAIVPPDVIEKIPHKPLASNVLPGYDEDKLLFIGHYWLSGKPEPLTPHIACLDYSIANQNPKATETGKLCAYRWNGEGELCNENFVWVDG